MPDNAITAAAAGGTQAASDSSAAHGALCLSRCRLVMIVPGVGAGAALAVPLSEATARAEEEASRSKRAARESAEGGRRSAAAPLVEEAAPAQAEAGGATRSAAAPLAEEAAPAQAKGGGLTRSAAAPLASAAARERCTQWPVFWHLCVEGAPLPALALRVVAGAEAAGRASSAVARGWHGGGLHVGFAREGEPFATISWGGGAVQLPVFEVLCVRPGAPAAPGVRVELVRASGGAVPSAPLVPLRAGWEPSGNEQLVAADAATGIAGKLNRVWGGVFCALAGREVRCETYDVACLVGADEPAAAAWLRGALPHLAGFESALLPAGAPRPPARRRFLLSVQELLDWNEASVTAEECSAVQLQPRPGLAPQPSSVLHCHDMMGGYMPHADEHYLSIFSDWRRLSHFCYFAHYRVSPPPRCWVEACHANGVPCIGTVIVEGASGAEVELLMQRPRECASQLAALAGAWGFEGWLVNIESDVPSFRHARDFVDELCLACRRELGERAVVIYYDSLGSSGQVEYQNGLADHTTAMLDVCDAVFTNYWWARRQLRESERLAMTPERRRRVFFGVDVFARGSVYRGHPPGPGAGVAVAAARARGFSVAVFAPGWSYENGGARVPDALLAGLGSSTDPEVRIAAAAALERARELDSAFWSALLDSPYQPSAWEALQDDFITLFGGCCSR
jgi:hypothetical protein